MEDAYIVKGGSVLKGEVTLSGAKNVSLKMIIAALLFEQEVILSHVPRINDVMELIELIKSLGGTAHFIEKNTLAVDGRNMNANKVDLLHSAKTRVSFMLFAPLLYKHKECFVPNPGGCRIGARPVDRVIEGMKALGVSIEYDSETGYYHAELKDSINGEYTFVKPSHTGTELLIMLSMIGSGMVTIHNAALEPEVDELITFLNESGGSIHRKGTDIIINGVASLKQTKPFTIISDRNEAATYVTTALATGGDIVIKGLPYSLFSTFIQAITEAGALVKKIDDMTYHFSAPYGLKAVSVETEPHPGFMTDWQQCWAILMTQAEGESIIHERIFEDRFQYVEELKKLGAKIQYVDVLVENPTEFYHFSFDPTHSYRHAVKIHGPQRLHNGVLTISDLRAGATLVTAALIAKGESVVNGASIVERGYEDFVEKLSLLGARIRKV
ncbi:UDP-N-acetylglucosamine 1-carboxyvinyltransferase [Candidatus Roizmanbacteria bacterium]|nr:UDP-N-acetylglucosamine 1-carboxyvinyltransferase [Candidatus Roizmanbacteria bacterium]